MADIVGLLAASLQLVDLVVKTRCYVKDFSDVPKDQTRLFEEIRSLEGLIAALDYRIRTSQAPGILNSALEELEEPLLQLKGAMEQLASKLEDLSKLSSRFAWPFWGKEEALKTGIWLEAYIMGSVEEIAHAQGEYSNDAKSILQDAIETQRVDNKWTLRETKINIINIHHGAGLSKSVKIIGRNQKHQHESKRVKIIKWYSPLNFFIRQADISNTRAPGTGEWFLQDDRFKEWREATGKILWCQGIPGAGKTVLVSMVVEHLRTDPNCGVAAIYLHHKEAPANTPSSLLASLWRQLVLGKDISPAVHRVYQEHRESHTRPSVDDDHVILCSVMAEYSQVFILVDALDEYPEEQRNVLLRRLTALRPAPNLIFTSRPHITIRHVIPHSEIQTLEIRATEGDLCRYVDAEISNSARLSKHVINCPELLEEIETKILRRSDGMFLLAKLHIDSLKTKLTVKAVRDALAQMPRDLDSTYDVVMTRINGQDEDEKDLAWKALSWVTNAKRPLRPLELRDALAVEPGTSTIDPDNLLDLDTILSVCAGLVILYEDGNKTGLIHPTAQGYLDRVQTRDFPDASTQITLTCITYLCFETFSPKIQGPDSPISTNLFRDHHLLDYAVKYCLIHAHGEAEINIRSHILVFIRNCLVWRQIWNWTHFIRVHKIKPSASLLWIAAFFHLEDICRYLILVEGAGSVLQEAASIGDTEMVRILLDNGVDSSLENPTYGTAMHAALKSDSNHGVLRLLIEHGADVNVSNKDHGPALYAASHHGNYILVRLLLEHGAAVNGTGRNRKTALYVAAYHGHNDIGRLLIKHGANVNAKGGHYGTALIVASHRRKYMFVRLLLEHGAEVHARGNQDETALYSASSEGHSDIVALLIEHGANVNAGVEEDPLFPPTFRPPLQIASWNGRHQVAQLLLKHGAKVNTIGQDDEGYISTALYSAVYRGHTDIVQLLLQHGAYVDAEGGQYGNPLHAASQRGHYDSARLLLVYGAAVNAKDNESQTPLYSASREGHSDIVELLCQQGADVNEEGGLYGNAMNAVSHKGHFESACLLIQHGADLSGRNGATALRLASSGGHQDILRLLMKNGAEELDVITSSGDPLSVFGLPGMKIRHIFHATDHEHSSGRRDFSSPSRFTDSMQSSINMDPRFPVSYDTGRRVLRPAKDPRIWVNFSAQ
ncbi:ankyrin repeat-containing domain protein [Mycena crocata]|nr:ankyrin repeat-containing domain protein [Mycena crocata]